MTTGRINQGASRASSRFVRVDRARLELGARVARVSLRRRRSFEPVDDTFYTKISVNSISFTIAFDRKSFKLFLILPFYFCSPDARSCVADAETSRSRSADARYTARRLRYDFATAYK